MLAADNWCLKVEERIYGPYTSQQLRKFAHEGRFAPWSMIAPAGSRAWREARSKNSFAAFFGLETQRPANSVRAFGKKDAAGEPAAAAPQPPVPETVTEKSGAIAQPEPRLANFVLIFDIVSAAASRVEAAVLCLGPAFRVAENVWTVTCELSAVGVRNAIAPYLLPRESILVIDATRGRTSWQNFPPETHAKLASAWAATRQ